MVNDSPLRTGVPKIDLRTENPLPVEPGFVKQYFLKIR